MRRRAAGLALAALALLGGRAAAAAATAAAAAVGVPPRAAGGLAGTLAVLGSSTSALRRRPFPNWAEQLGLEGAVGRVEGYARSGALARGGAGGNSLAAQVARWRRRGGGGGDVATVVYIGSNDLAGPGPLAASTRAYEAGVRALVAGGATARGGRLLLVLVHDGGATPRYNRDPAASRALRARTVAWNGFVARVARRNGAGTVDVFAAVDRVRRDPGAHGFANVTTADPGRSATTALYDDDFHFGRAGQAVIARAVAAALADGGPRRPRHPARRG